MNFPSLKTFEVESRITDFLNRKFEEYQKVFSPLDIYYPNNSFKGDGYQTGNLLKWEDKEYSNFISKELMDLTINLFEIDKPYGIQFFYNHMLEYGKGTSMAPHNHLHNEDYVMFIYLNDCNDGHTGFYLNDQQPEYKERTTVRVKPIKNTGVFFHAGIRHEGFPTYENKKIFVSGIRIDLR